MGLLPAADEGHLRKLGLTFEARLENSFICVVIDNYPLPPGLGRDRVDLLLRLPTSWPDGQPDMFWVHPEVQVAGRYPPAADYFEPHVGRQWQRWSRHLNGGWTAGDDLSTWLRIVNRELTKAAA